MSASFLGSESARRRRRILLSACHGESASVPAIRRSESGASKPLDRTQVVTALNSLIRPQPWVNWLLVAVGLALWGGAVWLGWSVDHSSSGLKEVLGLKHGRLTHVFSVACLLAVTQLSLVILWYRTRSRKDFQGRYRVWIWSSLTWALLFSAAASGWHLKCTPWLAAHFPRRFAGGLDSMWLAVAAVLVGSTCRLLSREMSRSSPHRWLLRGSMLVGSLLFLQRMAPNLVTFPHADEIRNAATALWPLLMASALLHHARYVIHVSNEVQPRQKLTSRVSPIVEQVWAEVVALGPSKATIARSIAPRRIWNAICHGGEKTLKWTRFMVTTIRKLRGKGVSTETTARRRKESAPLPAPTGDSRPKPGARAASKTTKTA